MDWRVNADDETPRKVDIIDSMYRAVDADAGKGDETTSSKERRMLSVADPADRVECEDESLGDCLWHGIAHPSARAGAVRRMSRAPFKPQARF